MKKDKVKKKLGRPRNKVVDTGYKAPKYPEVAPTKFMGYCKCKGMIVKKDLISKRVYICPACGKRAQLNKLKKTLEITTEKYTSKREYVQDTLQVDFKNHCESIGGGTDDHVKNINIAE